jgi:hypothetical protein
MSNKPNMSYCKFRNTLDALRQCRESLYEGEWPKDEELAAAKQLIRMCGELSADWSADFDPLKGEQ